MHLGSYGQAYFAAETVEVEEGKPTLAFKLFNELPGCTCRIHALQARHMPARPTPCTCWARV